MKQTKPIFDGLNNKKYNNKKISTINDVKEAFTIIDSLKEKDKELKVVKESLEKVTKRVEFVTYDEAKMTGTFVRLPERNELNADIKETLIVEFYNR